MDRITLIYLRGGPVATSENSIMLRDVASRILLLSAVLMGLTACESRSAAPGEGAPDGKIEPTPLNLVNPPFVRSFSGDQDTVPTSVAADRYGNVYLAGYYDGRADKVTLEGREVEGHGKHDIFIAKLNLEGELVWLRTVGTGGPDERFRIGVDSAGNSYLTGELFGELTLGATTLAKHSGTHFMASLDSSGSWTWARTVPLASQLLVVPTGDLYLKGRTDSDAKELDGYPVPRNTDILARADAQGSLRWFTDLDRTFNNVEPPLPALPDWHGSLMGVDANGFSHLWLGSVPGAPPVKSIATFDPDGALVGTKQISKETGYPFEMDRDGNIYSCYTSYPIGTTYDVETIIRKHDPQGRLLWSLPMGSLEEVSPRSVIPGLSGEVYVAGLFRGTVVFGDTTLTSQGYKDVYVIKIDPSGSVVWARSGGGALNDKFSAATVDSSGRLIIVGVHRGGRFAGTNLPSEYLKPFSGFVWALEP